jgi:hypothetical protein
MMMVRFCAAISVNENVQPGVDTVEVTVMCDCLDEVRPDGGLDVELHSLGECVNGQ